MQRNLFLLAQSIVTDVFFVLSEISCGATAVLYFAAFRWPRRYPDLFIIVKERSPTRNIHHAHYNSLILIGEIKSIQFEFFLIEGGSMGYPIAKQ